MASAIPPVAEGSLPVVHMGETLCVRRRDYRLGLVVVHQGEVFHMQGEQQIAFQYHPPIFSEYIRRIPPALIVGCFIATKVKDVAEHWQGHKDTFQIAASPIVTPGNSKDWETILGDDLQSVRPGWQKTEEAMFNAGLHIKYIGWKRKAHAAYDPKHYVIDPYLFAHDLPQSFKRYDLREMIAWAEDLLDWIDANHLTPAPAYHKLSAQLVRRHLNEGHSAKLNERLRDALPGNHYRYFANPNLCYPLVYEIDQSNAHHHSAASTAFPLKSALRAYTHDSFPEDEPLITPEDERWNELLGMAGVHLMKVSTPHYLTDRRFYIPPTDEYGDHLAWVFSNELAYMRSCGVKFHYIVGSYVSDELDIMPALYGKYAIQQIQEASPMRRAWLKGLLLSTYGMLGARPFESVNVSLIGAGESHRFHVGRERYMQLNLRKQPQGFARFANVIHRGLIEAETRVRTLRMARTLHQQGYHVLAIYADGVYISGENKQLPIDAMASNWRAKEIHHAYFPKTGQVICDEFEKLPGMIGKVRKTYASHYRNKEASREGNE